VDLAASYPVVLVDGTDGLSRALVDAGAEIGAQEVTGASSG
jgi:hypothetical protein